MAQPRILVTNDDGIQAPGLARLEQALCEVGEVHVYAPDREQSAVGHCVSLHRPLRVIRSGPRHFMVDGTPTDCVMLAVRNLMGFRPDLVFSGINPGPNLGDDVTYSGTVAGAFEGMLLGIPSIAVSMAHRGITYLDTAATVAVRLARHVLEHGMPGDTMLNVNVPCMAHDQLKGLSITRMGRRTYQDEIIRREDPRGGAYYWIGGATPSHVPEPGTDFEAVDRGHVSVTPLHRDLTHHAVLECFRGAGLDWQTR